MTLYQHKTVKLNRWTDTSGSRTKQMAMQLDSYSTNNMESSIPDMGVGAGTPPVVKKKSKKPTKSQWSYTPLSELQFPLTLPPGTYYIGDLCYALDDAVYDSIFGGIGGYSNGMYQKSLQEFFLVDSTAFGDGGYQGSDGNVYSVDAGIIGITPVSMMIQSGNGGHVHTFTHPLQVSFEEGLFTFTSIDKSLNINTLGRDEDEDEDQDQDQDQDTQENM